MRSPRVDFIEELVAPSLRVLSESWKTFFFLFIIIELRKVIVRTSLAGAATFRDDSSVAMYLQINCASQRKTIRRAELCPAFFPQNSPDTGPVDKGSQNVRSDTLGRISYKELFASPNNKRSTDWNNISRLGETFIFYIKLYRQ